MGRGAGVGPARGRHADESRRAALSAHRCAGGMTRAHEEVRSWRSPSTPSTCPHTGRERQLPPRRVRRCAASSRSRSARARCTFASTRRCSSARSSRSRSIDGLAAPGHRAALDRPRQGVVHPRARRRSSASRWASSRSTFAKSLISLTWTIAEWAFGIGVLTIVFAAVTWGRLRDAWMWLLTGLLLIALGARAAVVHVGGLAGAGRRARLVRDHLRRARRWSSRRASHPHAHAQASSRA